MSDHPAKRRFHGGRALLNLPGHESTAAIVAEVEDSATWKRGTGYDIEPKIVLQIANCDRSIAFTCDMENAREQANALHKVDTLIDTLTAFREALVLEHARYNKRAAKLARMKKKR